MTGTHSSIYSEATKIAEDYLGPAAPRFMSRLVISHLHKEPEELTVEDLEQLTSWVKIAVSMITDEDKVVNEFSARLQLLTK